MSKKKLLSIIIVSYKNLDDLKNCLNSIYKYNDIDSKLEIIIIDNSPNKKVYNYINREYEEVIVIDNDNNGFGQANNIGTEIANGKYLFFLNPDTILVEPLFRFAVNKFEQNNKLGLFGVKLVDENLESNMSFYFIDKKGIIYAQLIRFFNKLNFFIDGLMFTSGADLFVRKNLFLKCGKFDENIFMYNEESDLIKRIKNEGMNTAFFPEKKIIHLEGKTTKDKSQALKRRLDSTRYYCNKYNLDFEKYLIKEYRYNILKVFIFKLIDKERANILKKYNKIIKDFIN